jgi:hypothetical protein
MRLVDLLTHLVFNITLRSDWGRYYPEEQEKSLFLMLKHPSLFVLTRPALGRSCTRSSVMKFSRNHNY